MGNNQVKKDLNKNKFDFFLLKRVIGLVKFYCMIFVFVGVLVVVLVFLVMMCFFLIQKMVDDYIFVNDIKGFINIVFLIFVLLMVEIIFRYIFNFSVGWLG